MLIFFCSFALSLLPFKELNLEISFSGAHQKNNYFSSIPITGFHTCEKKRMNVKSSFREKYIVLPFETFNDTHYISKNCPQIIADHTEIKRLSKIAPISYLNFYINNFTMNETVDIGLLDKETNTSIIYTEFLIFVSNDKFSVKPLKSLKLDHSSPVIIMSTTFYLSLDPDFNNNPNHIIPTYHFLPAYIPYYSLLTFIPAIIMCLIFSRKQKDIRIPLLSNFFKISMFMPNTLLFGSSGLIIIIQSILYFLIRNSQPLHIQFFNNLALISTIFPIILRIYQGKLMNLITTEADFISASFGMIFFPHASALLLNTFNSVIFHSFRFKSSFFFTYSFISYLLVLFIVTRAIGYLSLFIFQKSYSIQFEKPEEFGPESFQNNQVQMPNIFYVIIYGISISAFLSKMAHHLVLVSMGLTEFDVNYVFTYFFIFLSFSALFSSIRTRYRTSEKKERGSWQEDHLFYNVIAALFVSIYMIIDMLFITKVNCFEMFIHCVAMIYTTFGVLFETGGAISFLIAFIQVYFSVLRFQMK